MLTIPLLAPTHDAGIGESPLEDARRNILRWEAMNPPPAGVVRTVRQDTNVRPILVVEAPPGTIESTRRSIVLTVAVYARNLSATGISFFFGKEAVPSNSRLSLASPIALGKVIQEGAVVTLLFPVAGSFVARPIVASIVRSRLAAEDVYEAGARFQQIDAVLPAHRSALGLEGMPHASSSAAVPVTLAANVLPR